MPFRQRDAKPCVSEIQWSFWRTGVICRRPDAGRRKRRNSVLSFLGRHGIWICVPADFICANCVPCSPVHAKTVLERRNERRSFFYKKKKNLCTASCEHGRSG